MDTLSQSTTIQKAKEQAVKYLKFDPKEDTTHYVQLDPGTSPSKAIVISVENNTGAILVYAGEAALDGDREWEFRVNTPGNPVEVYTISSEIYESTEQEFLLVMGVL